MILGTGLGGLTQDIRDATAIDYADIPHFPRTTVASHAGRLVCGQLNGVPIVAMEGRLHYYEGISLQDVTFPVRVMKALGAGTLVVTNAAGGMNPRYQLADLVLIEDHINLMGDNPLRGPNDDALGPRFPDMSEPYDGELMQLAQQAALELKIPVERGVFVAVSGPNLETRAEYRMLRLMGADLVGMSSVPEVLVARHAGMRVLACSIVTDRCLPDALEPVNVETIIKIAEQGGQKLSRLLHSFLGKLSERPA